MKIILLAAITTAIIFLCAAALYSIACKVVNYLANKLEKTQRFL